MKSYLLFSSQNCAEDLRVKLESSNYSPPPPPTSNTSPTTPTALLESLKNSDGTLPGSLAASIAPADMLNVWNATKLNNKNSGMVNTADGKFCFIKYTCTIACKGSIKVNIQLALKKKKNFSKFIFFIFNVIF